MELSANRIMKLFLVTIILILVGCASVPKEVVELSYITGQDLSQIYSSYRVLIQTHFENLRTQTLVFLENRWAPVFLEDFIKRGKLVEKAKGSDPKRVFEDVQDWVEVAIETIEAKKREMIDPINKDEKALMSSVDDAFARVLRANATITAHLNSLRKVQEVQDEALKALELKDLRDKINDGLIMASDRAKKGLEELKKTERLIERAEERKSNLLKILKGGTP